MKKRQRRSTGALRLSATEAARNFSELLNRIHYRRQTYLIERGGRAVCELRPVLYGAGFTGSDLVGLLEGLQGPPESYLDAVAEGIERQPAAEETRWQR